MKFETNLNFVIYPSYPSAGGVDERRASLETHELRYLGTSNLGYGTKIENRCIFASHESNTDKY